MAITYTLIASNTLSSSAASVTFSSIPNTYTDLVLKYSLRTDASQTWDNINLRCNGLNLDVHGTTSLEGSGSAASSQRTSNSSIVLLRYASNGNTATSNTFSNGEFYFPNYASSAKKPVGIFNVTETNATAAQMATIAGLWNDTGAISSIALNISVGNLFLSGSSFFLYGIKNS